MTITSSQMRVRSQPRLAFADSSRLRLFLGAILYLAQGMPQGVMFYGIAAWLAANGQSVAVVGSVFAAVSMPWASKFFLGAIIDLYTYLAMGRRRSWLVGTQYGIIARCVFSTIWSWRYEWYCFNQQQKSIQVPRFKLPN